MSTPEKRKSQIGAILVLIKSSSVLIKVPKYVKIPNYSKVPNYARVAILDRPRGKIERNLSDKRVKRAFPLCLAHTVIVLLPLPGLGADFLRLIKNFQIERIFCNKSAEKRRRSEGR